MEKRHTVQKEMVLDAVRKLGCHATADEICSAVTAACPTVSRGTVYRNLHVLSEEGEIKRVRVPGGADRFDHKCSEHCHAQCVECGRVFDVDTGNVPDIMKNVRENKEIKILGYEICFSGICTGCESSKL